MLHNPAVVVGHDLHKSAKLIIPVIQNLPGQGAGGELPVVLEEVGDELPILRLVGGFEGNQILIDQLRQLAQVVVDVGDAAAHAGGEVAAGAADDQHAPAGHIFA